MFRGYFNDMQDTIRANPAADQAKEMTRGMFKGASNMIQAGNGDAGYQAGMDFRNDEEKAREWGMAAQAAMTSNNPALMLQEAKRLSAQGASREAAALVQKAQQLKAQGAKNAAGSRPEDQAALAGQLLGQGDVAGSAAANQAGRAAQEKRMGESKFGEFALKQGMPEMAELVAGGMMTPQEGLKQIQSVTAIKDAGQRATALEQLKQQNRLALEEAKASNKAAGGGGAKKPVKMGDKYYNQMPDGSFEEVTVEGGNTSNRQSAARLESLGNPMRNIDEALEMARAGEGTGLSQLAGSVPGSAARKLNGFVTAIKADVGLTELIKLKAAGGTLGQITEKELNALESRITNLDPGSDNFEENLTFLRGSYERIYDQVVKDIVNADEPEQLSEAMLQGNVKDAIARGIGAPEGADVQVMQTPDGKLAYTVDGGRPQIYTGKK